MTQTGVLFVCLGNICRSPLAEIAFIDFVEKAGRRAQFLVDSAGTSGWHDGKLPDAGSMRIAKERGLSIEYQRSRKFIDEDFERFQFIVAMDDSNIENIQKLRVGEDGQVLKLRDFDTEGVGDDVPDPWQQPDDAFREVYDTIARCMPKLLSHIDRHRR